MFTFDPSNAVDRDGNIVVKSKEEASAAANINFETFLNLLVTQVQSQDPMNPQDPTEFTNQIAQYSAVEQQIQSNKYLEKMSDAAGLQAQTDLLGYLGAEVLAPMKDKFTFTEGQTSDITYELAGQAAKTVISIYNADGEKIFEENGEVKAGEHVFRWAGANDDGEQQPSGEYKIIIEAIDAEGDPVTLEQKTFKTAVGVETRGGLTSLVLEDGSLLSPDEIDTVRYF